MHTTIDNSHMTTIFWFLGMWMKRACFFIVFFLLDTRIVSFFLLSLCVMYSQILNGNKLCEGHSTFWVQKKKIIHEIYDVYADHTLNSPCCRSFWTRTGVFVETALKLCEHRSWLGFLFAYLGSIVSFRSARNMFLFLSFLPIQSGAWVCIGVFIFRFLKPRRRHRHSQELG